MLENLLLLFLVLGLATFIITREEERMAAYQTLYDESIGEEVTDITIHSEGIDDVVLQNKNDTWMVVKPEVFQANTEKVQQLFTLLSENADKEYSLEGKNLADYGLDKNKLSIRFNQVEFRFGKVNEITFQRYILKKDKMYLISETISSLMRSGAEGFKAQ